MKSIILAFGLLFACPALAAQISDPISVPVSVTVQNLAVIFDKICELPQEQRPEDVACETENNKAAEKVASR